MRKIIAYLLLVVLFSCKREKAQDNIADVPEPLKALITNTNSCVCNPYLDKYLWRHQTVYLSSCGGPACDCVTDYYDSTGQKMQMDSAYSPDQFRQDAQLIKHVWRCTP